MPTWKRLLIAWFFVPVHRLLFRLTNGRLLGCSCTSAGVPPASGGEGSFRGTNCSFLLTGPDFTSGSASEREQSGCS